MTWPSTVNKNDKQKIRTIILKTLYLLKNEISAQKIDKDVKSYYLAFIENFIYHTESDFDLLKK